jgi:hypothetical protein
MAFNPNLASVAAFPRPVSTVEASHWWPHPNSHWPVVSQEVLLSTQMLLATSAVSVEAAVVSPSLQITSERL